ncbi:MAG: methylmalonyl-CoA epimerase [Armatimonadetes bacterium]|nr:methylmalonyl-CoA epimerase [Armatimonadota bacterium]
MLHALDHIGFAVPNLEEALAALKNILGKGEVHFEEVDDQGVRVACIPLRDCNLELLEPTRADSPIAKFLEKKGPGVHHLAFAVDDVEEKLRVLSEGGVRLVDEKPRLGAEGKRIAFLHPKSTGGLLIELCDRKGES